MDVPGIVSSALDDEEVAARVSLGGEDALFVTPTRSLVYRGEGLLSDESVEELPHAAERVEVESGRRSATIRLSHGLEGDRELEVPADNVDAALHPILAGVFAVQGVTDAGESVVRTYRFSELTLVVTSDRVVKHIGEAVWDQDYEETRFADVTGIAVEEGNVASQLVLETAGHSERIKTPNEQARSVRETVEEALFDYHGVASREEFDRAVGTGEGADADAEAEAAETETTEPVSFAESDLDPIESSAATEDEAGGFGGSAFQTATAEPERDDVAAELEALHEAVERQQELLAEQQSTIERLAERLSRDQ